MLADVHDTFIDLLRAFNKCAISYNPTMVMMPTMDYKVLSIKIIDMDLLWYGMRSTVC